MKLKEELQKCREVTTIKERGIVEVPDIKKFNITTELGASQYFDQIESAITATKTYNCYLHFLKGLHFIFSISASHM